MKTEYTREELTIESEEFVHSTCCLCGGAGVTIDTMCHTFECPLSDQGVTVLSVTVKEVADMDAALVEVNIAEICSKCVLPLWMCPTAALILAADHKKLMRHCPTYAREVRRIKNEE